MIAMAPVMIEFMKSASAPTSTEHRLSFTEVLNNKRIAYSHMTISLFVECKDQKEVDRLWNKILKHGGKASRCGWISDKYGLSWQIIPKKFNDLTADENPKKVAAVM